VCHIRQFLQSRKGMTLVEVMVVIVVVGIIIAGASSLMTAANSSFRAISVRADLSRRARAAVEVVASRMRDASIVEQQLSGAWKVTVFRSGVGYDYLFSLSGDDLLMTLGSDVTVLTSDVASFSIVPFVSGATFAYQVSVRLESGSASRECSILVSLRR